MIEIVDIVDENNQVIRKIDKLEAHNKGLLHRTIIAELIDSKGNWTLVKQASNKQDPGQFVSPVGGHVTSGETEIDALKREAQEEIGLKDFKFKYVGRAIYNRRVRRKQENHFFIVYEIYSDLSPTINEESVDFRKFTPGELKAELKFHPLLFGDAFRFVINNFYKNYFA